MKLLFLTKKAKFNMVKECALKGVELLGKKLNYKLICVWVEYVEAVLNLVDKKYLKRYEILLKKTSRLSLYKQLKADIEFLIEILKEL